MRRPIQTLMVVVTALTAGAALLAQCATAAVEGGGGDGGECASPNVMCGSSCVDTDNDPDNCGGCGGVCMNGQVCSSSKCSASCGSSSMLCTPDGGKAFCASTQTDGKNCGSCGNVCPSGTCSGGKCSGDAGMSCGTGLTSCPGDGGATCVNEQTDDQHCGSCTTTCLAMVETCNEGACVSACTGGKTLCIPDGGAGDGGLVAHCADLQNDNTDCGACFAPCAGGATCTMGKCKSTLLGSGTASDPWHTSSALANCAAYKTSFPSAADGVYTTHPVSTDIGVYCDMSGVGVTYEDFGFGAYTKTYTGYAIVGAPDFSGSSEVDAAFAYLFTRNGGLTNLDKTWVSGNCCFINSTKTNFFAVDGDTYMYPGAGATFTCSPSGGYSASIIPLYLVNKATTISSITATQAGNTGTYGSCTVSTNPAIFVKKY